MSVFTDAFEQRLVNHILTLNKNEPLPKPYDEVCPEPKKSYVSEFIKVKESLSKTVSCAVYIYCNNYILAARRGDTAPSAPGRWNVPTGMIEKNELPKSAAIREVKEETGLLLDKSQLKFICLEKWNDQIHQGANYKVVLSGNPEDHPTGQGDGECSKYEWIPLDNLSDYKWAFNMDQRIIEYI